MEILPTSPTDRLGKALPTNEFVVAWVKETAALTQPDHVFWCDGSEAEKAYLTEQAVKQ